MELGGSGGGSPIVFSGGSLKMAASVLGSRKPVAMGLVKFKLYVT